MARSTYGSMTPANIFNPVSPSDTYVIYDQFHFKLKDHLEVPVKGWDAAVEVYRFYKEFNPQGVIGLCTIEYYKNLIRTYK